ncbi:MAG: lysine--tRNA ligase, partial [Pyrinomonadaceae bacterium]
RYADLIAGSLKLGSSDGELTPREVFIRRARLLREFRRFLDDHGYIEVETPMLSPLATGAVARPFETHHNALDIKLYARIAPELYLKRLLVGGFEKVYELNRNFRNEGLSSRHNPEFTMLEFYCAYMDVVGMMDFCEELLVSVTKQINAGAFVFGDHDIDFSTGWRRLSMKQAIVEFGHQQFASIQFDEKRLDNIDDLRRLALDIYDAEIKRASHAAADTDSDIFKQKAHDRTVTQKLYDTWNVAQLIVNIFEAVAERHLIQPTFITDFPKAISPLAKASPSNPEIAERFELYIAGMELANGFSELNDPAEQRERFLDQMKQRERGDEEAMAMDEDYIRALAYGMPPAAGIGIGIDRLVQILTGRRSIRDVILFPHMRPEKSVPPGE